ncbi:hypothetical protein HPB51_022370 [Rhipicephalus microplus]|uniref:Uncharacterized protein n=1 Tax=Rhipicephalus microplus TaxID=6941 RepID=A0A9J6DQA0_RHIMP|nr:hypothetical protein HPB51_022370 [Rhipicephalus microplus]
METYVLIPKELSLVIGDRATSTTTTNDSTTPSGDRPPAKEVTAAVWSNSRISRGTRFLPFQGTVRLDKLEVFGTLDQRDPRERHQDSALQNTHPTWDEATGGWGISSTVVETDVVAERRWRKERENEEGKDYDEWGSFPVAV